MIDDMGPSDFKIDIAETFEHLPHAPIVEAVIHWRARAEKPQPPDDFKQSLQARLPGYSDPKAQHKVQMEATVVPGAAGSMVHRAQWIGWRFESADKLHVAQFSRDGFAFSRLAPYEDWDRFTAEARRLWQVYREIAEPTEIQRLGVRVINVIEPVELDCLDEVLVLPPKSPAALPLEVAEFTHQTTFNVPSYPYQLNLIQTIRPPSSGQARDAGLILDLDVFTTQPQSADDQEVDRRLAEMRWLKDKAFFSCLTPEAVRRFQ
jgi:uncharacterized protein (TIGR04255 family)